MFREFQQVFCKFSSAKTMLNEQRRIKNAAGSPNRFSIRDSVNWKSLEQIEKS